MSGGLSEGVRVVLHPGDTLTDGTRVWVRSESEVLIPRNEPAGALDHAAPVLPGRAVPDAGRPRYPR